VTLHIKPQEALAALREVVEDAGRDHVDVNAGETSGCKYVRIGGDVPECIVGRVLHHMGVEISVLRQMDLDDEPVIETGGSAILSHHEVSMDHRARILLATAQGLQDKGKNWGATLDEVERVARDLVVTVPKSMS
jgi:hypothetical protein